MRRRYRRKTRRRKSRRGGTRHYYRLNTTPMIFEGPTRGGGDSRVSPGPQQVVNGVRMLGHSAANVWNDMLGNYRGMDPDVLQQPLGKKYS